MTEKEVLQQQETNGQTAFYLIAVGMFYHAYGCGAFALSRATGYRVLCKHRKGGDILTCGFPANQLDMVLQRIREADGEVEQTGEKAFLFRGLDGTPDEKLIRLPPIAVAAPRVLQAEGTIHRTLCRTGETARLHRAPGYGVEE